jgi:hypothetical protein
LALEGILLATKKMRQVSRLMAEAWMEIRVEALGPKCLVMMSMHRKDSHEIRMPPSKAIQLSWSRVLLARRFIHTTLMAKSVTTVAGMDLSNIFSSV